MLLKVSLSSSERKGVQLMLTRDDTFLLCKKAEATKRLFISRSNVFCTTRVLQPGVFRTHSGIVQPSTDRVGFNDLPNFRLQDVCPDAVKNTWLSLG